LIIQPFNPLTEYCVAWELNFVGTASFAVVQEVKITSAAIRIFLYIVDGFEK
jgi:hypothetical protein